LFREKFNFDENIEVAMECSPAYLELEDIDALRAMGFNRLSLGIQDFNDHVLDIVNRDASKLPVTSLVGRMREQGFDGVNLDIIYGLPGQTPENFKYNIEKTIEVNPDRIATFSYAHVPWVKKAQSVLEKVGIPSADEKLVLMEIAFDLLTKNGYMPIGMDHFAKKEDSLFKSMENNNLHRNFQGYCTKETTGQVYGFGSSSISQLDNGYYQNTKLVKDYIERINQTGWAFEKGYQVDLNERVIREVINEVMCNLFVDFAVIGNKFGLSAEEVKEIVAFDEKNLAEFIQDDLVVLGKDQVKIKENGAMVIRNIAMAFDPNLTVAANQYSKTI